jgi:serine/threonine protein kinase
LQLGDVAARQRFRDEIRSLGQVDHPNVVRIYTSGEDGHRLCYAMELVDGANFKALYRRLKRNEPLETLALSAREPERVNRTVPLGPRVFSRTRTVPAPS